MAFTIAFRLGDIQPFVGITERDNERALGLRGGLVTYSDDADGNETYKVTYSELNTRCDHIVDPLMEASGQKVDRLYVSNPVGDDAELLRDKPVAKDVTPLAPTELTAVA